jgi:serine/threonine protein kinase
LPLQSGQMLAHYRIAEKIGEGGMGEVYRAEDIKLGRSVAIKVLPEEFVQDSARVARFSREAQLLASLNHPNIAGIHGLEDAGGVTALALELVEGETLAERIERGPLSLEEAAPIAHQIAEALEAAHEKGIIHRDLKPANVKFAADGRVKVLDFGLAKAMEGESGTSDMTRSPTLSVQATQAGVIMGTAAYMSPEQAAGNAADRRADIWSFGVVLAEMLTGRRPFQGESVSYLLAAVLKDEPDLNLPGGTPRRVIHLLQRCLHKNPKQRLQAIGEARVLMAEYMADPLTFSEVEPTSSGPALQSPPARRSPLTLMLAAAALLLGAAAAWMLKPLPPAIAAPDLRFEIMLGQGLSFSSNYNRVVTISPDARTIAYTAEGLWLRTLDETRPRMIPDTKNARSLAFSSDSRQLAFWENGHIKRVDLNEGVPIAVGPLQERPLGMHWNEDGFIYVGRADRGIWKVSASGGEPEQILDLEKGEYAHGPELLPGGKWVLFTLCHGVRAWAEGSIVAQSLENNERRELIHRGREVRFTSSGHLTYVQENTLFAAPFDVDRVEITGGAVAMETNLHTSGEDETGAAGYDISDTGMLVFAPPAGSGARSARLAFLDRAGVRTLLPVDARRYGSANLSPDGDRVAAQINNIEGTHIWIITVARDGAQRLTATGRNTDPVWSHDGRYIYFASDRDGDTDIWRRPADLSAPAEKILDAEGAQLPTSVSRDGAWLLYTLMAPGNSDIGRIALTEDPTPAILVDSPADETNGQLSPDGRFICFQSDETGRWDIHVMEIATGRRWIVSSEGYSPFWTHDGKRIMYMSDSEQFLGIDVETDPQFKASEPALAVRLDSRIGGQAFDVTHDGGQILVGAEDSSDELAETRPRVTVVLNWFDHLKDRVGP